MLPTCTVSAFLIRLKTLSEKSCLKKSRIFGLAPCYLRSQRLLVLLYRTSNIHKNFVNVRTRPKVQLVKVSQKNLFTTKIEKKPNTRSNDRKSLKTRDVSRNACGFGFFDFVKLCNLKRFFYETFTSWTFGRVLTLTKFSRILLVLYSGWAAFVTWGNKAPNQIFVIFFKRDFFW